MPNPVWLELQAVSLFVPLNDTDFRRVLAGLLTQNLKALFGPDVDQNLAVDQFAQWTQKNWRLITELVKLLDHTLGPSAAPGEARLVTPTVIEAVETRWMRRTR